MTNKQMSGNQRRTLRSMRARLLKMSMEWDGVDQYCMSVLEELADKCEQVAVEIMQDIYQETE